MKLNYKRTILVGFAFFLICVFWQAYDTIIPKILTNKFQLSQTVSGAIMAIDNILALFLLPLFGSISDRCKSRIGRRTPFIIVGTIAASTLFVILSLINTLWAFMALLFFILISMAIFRSPAVALMPDVTLKPLRSKGNAIINLMGAVGGIIVLALGIVFGTGKPENANMSYLGFFSTVAGIMLISLLIFLWQVKEPKWAAETDRQNALLDQAKAETEVSKTESRKLTKGEKISLFLILASVILWFMGYNAITSKYSVYAGQVLGLDYNLTLIVAQAAAIVSYIPVGIIASKIGRKKTILAGIIILFVAVFCAIFITSESPAIIINILFALAGIGWATINVNSFPMVVELSKAGDVGKYTGFYYTASMAAQTVTPVFSGVFLDSIGMHTLFPYASIFIGLAFVTMFFVKHGDSKPERSGNLEALGGADD